MNIENDPQDTWDAYLTSDREDQSAFERLVNIYTPVAVEMATPIEIGGHYFSHDDVMPFALAGLKVNIRRYDPGKNPAFNSHVRSSLREISLGPAWQRYAQQQHGGNGSTDWHQVLLEWHLPLVQTAAKLYTHKHPMFSAEELVTPAFFGLTDAVRHYDYRRYILFSTFASHRMRGSINDEVRGMDPFPRLVRSRSKKIKGMMERGKRYQIDHPEDARPIEEIIMEIEDIDENMFKRIQSDAMRGKNPIDIEFLARRENKTKGDFEQRGINNMGLAPTTARFAFDEPRATHEDVHYFAQIIASYPDKRARDMASLYFFHGFTMKEVGETFGISESRTSQQMSGLLKYSVDYIASDIVNDASAAFFVLSENRMKRISELIRKGNQNNVDARRLKRFFSMTSFFEDFHNPETPPGMTNDTGELEELFMMLGGSNDELQAPSPVPEDIKNVDNGKR